MHDRERRLDDCLQSILTVHREVRMEIKLTCERLSTSLTDIVHQGERQNALHKNAMREVVSKLEDVCVALTRMMTKFPGGKMLNHLTDAKTFAPSLRMIKSSVESMLSTFRMFYGDFSR